MHIIVKLVILASMFSDRVGKGERKGKGVCGFVSSCERTNDVMKSV